MDIRAYLFTVNQSRATRLDPDELKDVQQESEITLSQKDYNDQVARLTILDFYRRAVTRKIKQQQIAAELAYSDQVYTDDNNDLEIQKEREMKLSRLDLSPVQKKIVTHLINGMSYEEVRKKLKLSVEQLRSHCKHIKKKNSKQ